MTIAVADPYSPEVAAGLACLDGPGEPCRNCGATWHYTLTVDDAMLFIKHHKCGPPQSCYLTRYGFVTWRNIP